MPTQAKSPRRHVAAAAIAGAIALGATLAFPGVGQAQTEETTTTTVVEETTEPTTETTAPSDQSSDETRPERGDGNCDHAEEETTDA
jgi:hypothetical protein